MSLPLVGVCAPGARALKIVYSIDASLFSTIEYTSRIGLAMLFSVPSLILFRISYPKAVTISQFFYSQI